MLKAHEQSRQRNIIQTSATNCLKTKCEENNSTTHSQWMRHYWVLTEWADH